MSLTLDCIYAYFSGIKLQSEVFYDACIGSMVLPVEPLPECMGPCRAYKHILPGRW